MHKILIVDDDPDVLQVMHLTLASRNYEVMGTTKGEQTFELINSFQPALIFLDINLGGMDGRDISRQIKGNEETKHIPVIIFSANFIKDTTLKESMADAFIPKPFDIHELLVKVNSLLAKHDDADSMIA